jgi:hypothetical protein
MARNEAYEYARELKRKPDADGKEDVDQFIAPAVGAGAIESRLLLGKLVASIPSRKMSTFHSLVRHLQGEDFSTLAREQGIQVDALRKRVTTLHERILARGAAIGAIGVLVLVLVGAWYALRPKPQEAQRHPQTAPTSAPATSTGPVSDNSANLEQAGKLRDRAFAECTANRWAQCSDDLDAAIKLDGTLANDPLMQAALKDVDDARHAGKHEFVPPKVRAYAPQGGTR